MGILSNIKNMVSRISHKVMILALLITLLLVGNAITNGLSDPVYISLMAINSFLCSMMILAPDKQASTLNKFINVFLLLFFISANSIQYASRHLVISFYMDFSSSDYRLFQALTAVIIIIYNSFYLYIYNRNIHRSRKYCKRLYQWTFSDNKLILLSIIAAILLLFAINFDISALFSVFDWNQHACLLIKKLNLPVFAILEHCIRPIPIACLIISILNRNKVSTQIVLLILSIFTMCPTGLARNMTAMFWLPVALIFCERHLKPYATLLIILVSILFVFPFLSIFRVQPEKRDLQLGNKYYNTISYDASQMMMATIRTDTTTNGHQLMGVLLFYVPRTVWDAKPKGSGQVIAEKNKASFTNVSMPFFSEGFIDFGWGGVIAYTLFLAWGSAAIDARFSALRKFRKGRQWYLGFYLILVASVIFIMRGTLMVAFASTVANLTCYLLCSLICHKTTNHKGITQHKPSVSNP